MPNHDDYHAYNSTKGSSRGSGGSGGGMSGPGKFIIILLLLMLLYFIFNGASWDAIDSLLGIGFLVFLFANWLGK